MNKTGLVAACRSTANGMRGYIYERLVTAKGAIGKKSYAQEGEDRVLARYFDSVKSGVYVDVGAHNPMRFSNTFLFYKRGWRGVNIDAMPGSMVAFNRHRPGDINIEVGIGTVTQDLQFFVFQEAALNSFDESLARRRENEKYKIVDVLKVPVRPLSEVLVPYLPRLSGPSFLTVDVEGRDLDALKSNDWASFRPTFVLVEIFGTTIREAMDSDVTHFMMSNGYTFVAKTLNTAFFRRN